MRLLLIIIFTLTFFVSGIGQGRQKSYKAVGVTASLPWVNSYYYYDYDVGKAALKSGFVGIGASAFYMNGDDKLSVSLGFTGDANTPFGFFDSQMDNIRKSISSEFLEITLHRRIVDRYSAVLGVGYIAYQFGYFNYVDSVPAYFMSDQTIGLVLGGEYRLSKLISVALFYRPTIVGLDQKQYRHLISLDARFDFNFWRKLKQPTTSVLDIAGLTGYVANHFSK